MARCSKIFSLKNKSKFSFKLKFRTIS
jgi:hypothetical protein